MRTAAEAEAQLRAFEAKSGVLTHQVDGWSIWPIFRLPIGVALQELPMTRPGQRLAWSQRLRLSLADAVALLRIRPLPFAAKAYTSGLVDQVNNRYKDVWFDEILLALGTGQKVETVNNAAFLIRRKSSANPAQLTTTLAELATSMCSRLIRPRGILETAGKIADALADFFGPGVFTVSWVTREILHFHWNRIFARAILRRMRPEVLMLADPSEYAWCAAARELGITVVEFQHGFVDGVTHPSYAWNRNAFQYRDTMPLPSRVFLVGEYWRTSLEANGFWTDRLQTIGSARIDEFRHRRSQVQREGARRLVVTSQGIDVPFVAEFLRQTMELARSRGRPFELVVKLHPVYESVPSPYSTVLGAESDFRIVDGASEPSTFELLCRADAHASISSTCHFEAAGLGVPTAVLPFSSAEVMDQARDEGMATLVKTPEEFFTFIESARDGESSPEVSARLFSPGAVGAAVRELEAVRKGRAGSSKGAVGYIAGL